MTVVALAETGPGVTVDLTREQARLLAASGLVDISPAVGGRWRVRGQGKVGVARLGDVELRIEPKVPVARLLFLLGYARVRQQELASDTKIIHPERGVDDLMIR